MDGVCACGHLGSVEQFGRADGGDVDEIGDALDVAEETHATVRAIDLCDECAVEGDNDRQREHNALECAGDTLTRHGAIAVLCICASQSFLASTFRT